MSGSPWRWTLPASSVSNAKEKGTVSEVVRGLVRNEREEARLVGDAGITDAGAGALAGALEANTSLQELDLVNNKITGHANEALLEAWGARRDPWKCPLRTLVGDAWVAKAAEQLKTDSSRQVLNLSCNQITDAGAEALAGALEANTSLQKLDLGENQITVHAQNALLEAQGKHRERSKLFLYLGEGSENGLVENEFQ